mgnify:CR=1 FL=1
MAKTESEILIVRMRSGEDVIAQTTKTATGYHLKSPAMLVPTGKGGLGLMPWLMYAEISDGVDIPTEATFFHVRPLKGVWKEGILLRFCFQVSHPIKVYFHTFQIEVGNRLNPSPLFA